MTLCLFIKFVQFFAVIYGFRVNLLVAYEHLLPDGLARFFEVQYEVALLVYGPEGVLGLDLLAKLAFEERRLFWSGVLQPDADVLGLKRDK